MWFVYAAVGPAIWAFLDHLDTGAFLVASYIPYLAALESAEASVVGETLRPTQIVGGLLTSTGAALLTLDLRKGTRRLPWRSCGRV